MLAPEPFLTSVVLAGGRRRPRPAPPSSAPRCSARSPPGESVLAFAHAEPGTRWSASAAGGDRRAGRRRTGRSPGSRSRCRTAPAPTGSWSAPRCPTAAPGCSWSTGDAAGLTRDRLRRPTTAAAPPGSRFDGTPADAARRGRPTRTAAIARALDIARIDGLQPGDRRDAGRAATRRRSTSPAASSSASPLNTFQALTFRAADMYVSLELATSVAAWATMVLAAGDDRGGGRGRRPRAACRSAAPAGTSARRRSSCTAASG